MSRSLRAIVLAAVAFAVASTPAAAHQGNPNYRSVIDRVSPVVPGVKLQVLGYDSQFQLTNRSGKTVTVYGYAGEPYARILGDGTVQQNRLSPATYLNNNDFITAPAPKFTNAKAPPQWKNVDKTSTFVWHDHRMHWMGTNLPPQVKNKHEKTKIFNYRIPLSVGSQKGQLSGTLFWVGSPGGFPVAAIVSLVAVALVVLIGVVAIRRRRQGTSPRPEAPGPAEEAW
ncbi:MAG TPA: hypothetical protein VH817_02430 [Thermoleophilaceae bacterium]|jgi:hypothetical protein